jgi:hypothetical protein
MGQDSNPARAKHKHTFIALLCHLINLSSSYKLTYYSHCHAPVITSSSQAARPTALHFHVWSSLHSSLFSPIIRISRHSCNRVTTNLTHSLNDAPHALNDAPHALNDAPHSRTRRCTISLTHLTMHLTHLTIHHLIQALDDARLSCTRTTHITYALKRKAQHAKEHPHKERCTAQDMHEERCTAQHTTR